MRPILLFPLLLASSSALAQKGGGTNVVGPPSPPTPPAVVNGYKVTYSGGTWRSTGPNGDASGLYTNPTNVDPNLSSTPSDEGWADSGGCGHEVYPAVHSPDHGTAESKGKLTATFAWVGPNPAPPASSVVVRKDVRVSCAGDSGSVSDGLGRSSTIGDLPAPPPPDPAPVDPMSRELVGTGYEVGGGQSFTVECEPIASAGVAQGSPSWQHASATVSFRVSYTRATIESDYAVKMGNVFNFLVGQQADFHVSAGPYGTLSHTWSSGGQKVDSVAVGADHPAPAFPGWRYADSRTTIRDNGQNAQAQPSWYYDGDDNLTEVTCICEAFIGLQPIGVLTLSRDIYVYRPTVSLSYTLGPSRIEDPDRYSVSDDELAQATSKATGASGIIYDGTLTIPQLFTDRQGLGGWSYVQKVSATKRENGVLAENTPWGLDNTYPYGGLLPPDYGPDFVKWCPTGASFRFADSPGRGISGLQSVEVNFFARHFVALRPPLYPGQGWFDMPIKKSGWKWIVTSNRDNQLRWESANQYAFFPNGSGGWWETTPSGVGVTSDGAIEDAHSEDMDWNSVAMNTVP